jgi:hypothetical protein
MTDRPTVTVVGEDALCCRLGERLVFHALPTWRISPQPIDKGGITKLIPDLSRFSRAARFGSPVLCIADTDRECPVLLVRTWLSAKEHHARLLLRLAVTEAESWLLADHVGMFAQFRTPLSKLPERPDELGDPKGVLMQLLSRYAPAAIRRDMLVTDQAGRPRRASGYAAQLGAFTEGAWDPARAASRSPSLKRALDRLTAWQGMVGMPSQP